MIVEARIERNVRQLAAASGDIASIWLCGSRANGEAGESADWDLVVFGTRSAAQALERGGNFLGRDVDLLFVDVGSGELKRLWKADAWEDFSSWRWTELSPGEAEYHCARFTEQLVMLNGEWVEAGALSVTRKKAYQLWPPPAPPQLDEPYVN